MAVGSVINHQWLTSLPAEICILALFKRKRLVRSAGGQVPTEGAQAECYPQLLDLADRLAIRSPDFASRRQPGLAGSDWEAFIENHSLWWEVLSVLQAEACRSNMSAGLPCGNPFGEGCRGDDARPLYANQYMNPAAMKAYRDQHHK